MEPELPLSSIAGIGSAYISRLRNLELKTVKDLIYHFPFRYDDFSQNLTSTEIKIGEKVTIQGEIWSIKNIYTRTRKLLTTAILNDGKGTIELIWFNQSWLTKNIKTGDKLQVSGKTSRKGTKITILMPQWEKIDSFQSSAISHQAIHTGRIVPVYPETAGLSSKWLRFKIAGLLPKILPQIVDPLPIEIQNEMLPLNKALDQIHFPDDWQSAREAQERLAFDELFYIQLSSQQRRSIWKQKTLIKPLRANEKKLNEFIKSLPFELTSAQKKVIKEITLDLKKPFPMNRLVQGEVGSGKTVVAAAIIYLAHINHLKSVIMAPTEILAFQHFSTLTKLLAPYGIEIGIYTGSRKFTKNNVIASKAKQSNPEIAASPMAPRNDNNGSPNVIVGTHALLSEKLDLSNVGLVVVDEQQRFGVEQRGLIRARTKSPHFLTMTATPIPRTVALTLYGDLDLSIINELPKGRKIIKTHYVPNKKRDDAYKFITEHIERGEQVYIITPLIEESETNLSAKAAKVEFEKLKQKVFPQFKLGLLHGRLKSKEKEQVINEFKDHKIDILVSTSVVEVGVDVPNASIMVIEGADRFGLAQLHQLRGRVGRGETQSYTFLFAEQENSANISRLKNLEKIQDGLKLAELDLKIRGSGEIFGTLQSGRWNLKIASLDDLRMIERTKTAASDILNLSPNLDKYPLLQAKLAGYTQEIFPD